MPWHQVWAQLPKPFQGSKVNFSSEACRVLHSERADLGQPWNSGPDRHLEPGRQGLSAESPVSFSASRKRFPTANNKRGEAQLGRPSPGAAGDSPCREQPSIQSESLT